MHTHREGPNTAARRPAEIGSYFEGLVYGSCLLAVLLKDLREEEKERKRNDRRWFPFARLRGSSDKRMDQSRKDSSLPDGLVSLLRNSVRGLLSSEKSVQEYSLLVVRATSLR